MRSVMICTPHQILGLFDKVKENEMGSACGTYGREEEYEHGSNAKPE